MVEGMDAIVVTVSGYRGSERMKLIKLVSLAGANYVGKMSRSITHLVCWKFKGKKYELAKKFGTLIVNHQWLDDCIKKGKLVPESPYTMQSGQEVGFNIQSLPVPEKTTGILHENELLLNEPNIHDCLDDVVDLVSDEIGNDAWDEDPLLDESMFPGPSSRNAARLRSKRKLVKETYKEDSRGKADMRMNFHEPRKPTIAELQQRPSDNDVTMRQDCAESSHRSRRLVKRYGKRNITEIDTIDKARQQNRTCTDISKHIVASGVPNDLNDLFMAMEASINRRLESAFAGHGQSGNEINHTKDVIPLLNPSLHDNDSMNAKGRNMEQTSPDVQNCNGEELGDLSKVEASLELSCVICWTEFSSVRGVLPCGHRFCFSCIQSWADRLATNRKESTCPLCKTIFSTITRVDAAAFLDQKIYSQTIPSPLSSQDIFIVPEGRPFRSDFQDMILPVCCQCLSRDPVDLLISCDICAFSCIHHYCLDPPMTPWICNYCRDRRFLFRT
ncbi:uncharacterized protein LOC130815491 isoform X1 [Amaranthus tricolor]|uniref:uncharacterized protein LOC130815491 isoform X1 n=1 Tax=Amaranthus tricolor TaxID=29722 RepID=UPI00258589DE|nr:uncharacterized protein LOC130815491 isoform X1 [Amaranthus tricolor]XP_057537960.1 uncharacterized protein LOC130815491 isoform X1 [Amaranthus tricolor]